MMLMRQTYGDKKLAYPEHMHHVLPLLRQYKRPLFVIPGSMNMTQYGHSGTGEDITAE